LNRAGWPVVVVTNQSAVGRGMLSEAELAAIHATLAELLAARGARLDAIYSCPHHPTEARGAFLCNCECRKPKPGLLLQAARELGLDLGRSWIVGDSERDLAAGAAVGARGVLVATGKGALERERLAREGRAPRWCAAGIGPAVEIALREAGG
jgi:D-glycero-D-manno-heptose 1,7-bisphosphate phosphatase